YLFVMSSDPFSRSVLSVFGWFRLASAPCRRRRVWGSDGGSATFFALLGIQEQHHVLCGCIEQTHEALRRSHKGGEQLGACFVLAGQARQLILNRLGVEHLPVEHARLDDELLVVLGELLGD